jgi:LPXTG-site transpeptidase (sortase) family protein
VHQLGNALIALGGGLIAFAALWQVGIVPGSRVVLPAPVALQRTAMPVPTTVFMTPDPTPPPAPTLLPLPNPAPAPTLSPLAKLPKISAPLPAAPDAGDRAADAHYPPPGYAVRLAIRSIKLDTEVKQGGIVLDANGNPTYQTLPFVAVHYGDLTALVGAHGNAVIAGHVVTLREGNVFRFLYKLDLNDEIAVWDQSQREHDFKVTEVKLVPPDDLSPMAQTYDPTLTLITCGGTFDPVKREFSDRLIVTAKPI